MPSSSQRRAGFSEKGTAERTPLVTIILAVVLFVVTRAYLLFQIVPMVTDVPQSYFKHAALTIDLHNVPYRDVKIEYPPLAWWVTCIPRLLDDRRISDPQSAEQVDPIRQTYHATYRGLMFLCDLACFPLLLAIAWKRRMDLAGWIVLSYTLTTACLGHLLYDRLDVALLLLLILWAYCWIQSLEETSQSMAWLGAAYCLFGLSISFKLIPIVGCPFLLLSEWHAPRRMMRLAVALPCLVGSAVWPFVIQYAVSGPEVFSVFGHHAERGIQIESIYASVILIVSLFGMDGTIENTHGAFEVFCSWSPAMKTTATILLLGFLCGTGLWALVRWSRFRREDAYCTACFVIAAVVILSNVFSPQYLIWAVTMMLLFALERLPNGQTSAWVLFGLVITMIVLTTWLFPFNYFRTHLPLPSGSIYGLVPDGKTFTSPSPVACTVLAVRNAMYLGILAWLGVLLVRRSGLQTAGTGHRSANR